MDNLTYTYNPGTNQLNRVADATPDASAVEYPKFNDIKQGQAPNNYTYDAIGNLTADQTEGITNINWTVYGKIASITKNQGPAISYTYDAAGNRISKTVGGTTTWYVRDAQGNTMATYQSGNASLNAGRLTQSEIHLYGSSRLGIYNQNADVEVLAPAPAVPVVINGVTYFGKQRSFTTGNKLFELSNHLGNVLATITDRKLQTGTASSFSYLPEVVTATDYAPFGMALAGRNVQAGNYRYGFNGKENDNEISGAGNKLDFGARIYDSRLGRWLSVDPLQAKYPSYSPYNYAINSPILLIDIDGRVIGNPNDANVKKVIAVLQRTDAGKVALANWENSKRVISLYFHSKGVKNDLVGKAISKLSGGFTTSLSTFERLKTGEISKEDEDFEKNYKFDPSTGNYIATSEFDKTVIVVNYGRIQELMGKNEVMSKTNPDFTEGLELTEVVVHELNHATKDKKIEFLKKVKDKIKGLFVDQSNNKDAEEVPYEKRIQEINALKAGEVAKSEYEGKERKNKKLKTDE